MQILAGLALLAVLIVFHELGHYLFAKMLGVRVLVFSVGFGPKLFGFKIKETEYRLSAIPLGGYIRMFGESLEEELSDEEKKVSFMHQPIWRKSLIAVAGPLFNFILPIFLFFALIVGHEQVMLPRIGTILPDSPAEEAGLLPDDKILAINDVPVSSFNEMAEIVAQNPVQELRLSIERPRLDGPAIMSIKVVPEAKPSGNPLDKKLVGRIGVMPATEKPIVVLSSQSPFQGSELKDFDEITEIDGKTILSARSLDKALDQLWPGSIIKVRREDAKNSSKVEEFSLKVPNIHLKAFSVEPVLNNQLQEKTLSENTTILVEKTKKLLIEEAKKNQKNWGLATAKNFVSEVQKDSIAASLGIAAKDRIIAINGEPFLSTLHLQQSLFQDKEPKVIGVLSHKNELLISIFMMPADSEERLTLDSDLKSIFGIAMPEIYKAGESISREVGIAEAAKRAVLQTWSIVVMTAKSLWLLVSGEVSASHIGGPLQLFDVAQQAANKSLHHYLFIMCLLSVNLGLLNLLPIPALDGGHLLLFGIEAIQRKPLSLKTRSVATQIGVALLLSLMALAIFNDISRLFRS